MLFSTHPVLCFTRQQSPLFLQNTVIIPDVSLNWCHRSVYIIFLNKVIERLYLYDCFQIFFLFFVYWFEIFISLPANLYGSFLSSDYLAFFESVSFIALTSLCTAAGSVLFDTYVVCDSYQYCHT